MALDSSHGMGGRNDILRIIYEPAKAGCQVSYADSYVDYVYDVRVVICIHWPSFIVMKFEFRSEAKWCKSIIKENSFQTRILQTFLKT